MDARGRSGREGALVVRRAARAAPGAAKRPHRSCGPGGAGSLGDEPAPEANGDGVGSGPGLELGEQVANVRLDRLLREEEAGTDLTVDEPVGNELKNFQLATRRLLLDAERRTEGNDLAAGRARATLRDFLEPSRVVDITAQDFLSLCGVHGFGIGLRRRPL